MKLNFVNEEQEILANAFGISEERIKALQDSLYEFITKNMEEEVSVVETYSKLAEFCETYEELLTVVNAFEAFIHKHGEVITE